jgi:GTP:adenosylcobinamide-phosphate guanylyltransferase
MKTFIIQCGGCGTRMGRLTSVKPKALIPIGGKPIIFHLFDNNPNCRFIVICDYASVVLINYIKKYRPNLDIQFVISKEKSTSSGITEALQSVSGPFFILWSDLLVKQEIQEPNINTIGVGITTPQNAFPCRWSFRHQKLIKESSNINGVAGIFYFKDKKYLSELDETQSFTAFLSNKFVESFDISNIDDVGTEDRFYLLNKTNRFFNRLEFTKNTVHKEAIVEEYKKLITDEIGWYEYLKTHGFNRIPNLISKHPFIMERLNGKNPFNTVPSEQFLKDVITTIKCIHELEFVPTDINELEMVYLTKTLERVYEVADLIPFFKDEYITINKQTYTNPFHPNHIEKFKEQIKTLYTVKNFTLIHGDCTFSNMINVGDKCFLIDPRGYFGKNKLYGDPRYDWAKLYYSFIGNYDNVNSKKYSVEVTDSEVSFSIDTNGWEKYKDLFFNMIPYTKKEIQFLHVLIWFSLCGYVKEDYSSILLVFYNGVKLYNEFLNL